MLFRDQNFNENEMELKMENHTHAYKGTNLTLQLM